MNEEIVLVVGAGTMGAGIAFVAARGGYRVELVEPDAAARERGIARVAADAERAGDPSIPGRIRWIPALESRSEAAIAIEAAPERLEIKREMFAALAAALDPRALLATNTSSLSVEELADTVVSPERVIGLHFFNPPAAMKLIEIVYAPQTGDEAIERARAFAERVGKTAVLAADTPGFIVNRVARPYYLQALRALDREVATAEELDALARSAGFRMGPFELMDLIGLDVNLATSESVYARTEAVRLEPLARQREMVAAGLLGRKSGQGFYRYGDGAPERLDATVVVPDDAQPDTSEFVAVVGFGGAADELVEVIAQHYTRVQRIENDEFLDELSLEATIVVDIGDGTTDRGEIVAELDSLLDPQTVIFVDAYATDLQVAARRMRHPERLIGYGILGSLAGQKAVEIVDSQTASDDALELAQEFFASIGKGVVLVEDTPGLFLGRTVGGIVNEAMIVIADGVAGPDDVDTAMRLGTNYPIGPVAWGREIGGARVARILQRVADADGIAFAPHRSLWVLDVDQEGETEPTPMPLDRPVL